MEKKKKPLLAVIVIVLVIAGGSFYGYWQKQGETEVFPVRENGLKSETVVTEGQSEEKMDTVYVSGAVMQPGIVNVAHGKRVIDAIQAAGGLAPDADTGKVNLAQAIKDGMHVHVAAQRVVAQDTAGKKETKRNGSGDASGASERKININGATKEELDQLPGIGPVMAERIVEYREQYGPFRKISDIKKVKGISEAKYKDFEERIVVE